MTRPTMRSATTAQSSVANSGHSVATMTASAPRQASKALGATEMRVARVVLVAAQRRGAGIGGDRVVDAQVRATSQESPAEPKRRRLAQVVGAGLERQAEERHTPTCERSAERVARGRRPATRPAARWTARWPRAAARRRHGRAPASAAHEPARGSRNRRSPGPARGSSDRCARPGPCRRRRLARQRRSRRQGARARSRMPSWRRGRRWRRP